MFWEKGLAECFTLSFFIITGRVLFHTGLIVQLYMWVGQAFGAFRTSSGNMHKSVLYDKVVQG